MHVHLLDISIFSIVSMKTQWWNYATLFYLFISSLKTQTSVLSFHQLVENADERFLLDNEALYDTCFRLAALKASAAHVGVPFLVRAPSA